MASTRPEAKLLCIICLAQYSHDLTASGLSTRRLSLSYVDKEGSKGRQNVQHKEVGRERFRVN